MRKDSCTGQKVLTRMRLWKLTPANLSDPRWQDRICRGPVFVRAADEGGARDLAARHAPQTAAVRRYRPLETNLWQDNGAADCVPVDAHSAMLSEEGPEAFLMCDSQH